MIKKITILTILIVTIIAYAITYKNANNAFSNGSGSPGGYSSSPGDNNKDCGSCHGGTATSVTGWITTNIPGTGYVGGTSYSISVTATASSVNKGFELTAESTTNAKVGTFTAGTGTALVNSSKAVTQSSAVSSSPKTWTCTWKAPAAGTGAVTFYACFALGSSGSSANKKCSIAVNESTVGIPSSSVENNFISFYPNPAKDQLMINIADADNVKLSVYNIQGQLLIEQAATQKINQINISNLEKGIYLLKAESTKGVVLSRFIKD